MIKTIIKKFVAELFAASIMTAMIVVPSNAEEFTPIVEDTFEGHTYHVFEEAMLYTEAEEYCKAIGGHLVTITSLEENNFVYNSVKKGKKDAYWIGLTDAGSEGHFYWVTFEDLTFTNWNLGEPNNRGDEDFVEMRRSNGRWNDNSSKSSNTVRDYTLSEHGFVCEWDYIFTSYKSEVSQWSSPEMEEAYNTGLVPENLIGENLTEPISRAEFAAVSVKLYEALTGAEFAAAGTYFTDIEGNVNKAEIEKASTLNIAVGVSDTEFAPNDGLTREQLATMLCRTIKKYKFNGWTIDTDAEYYLDSEGVKKFADDDLISDYAKPSVYYMVKMGIINGIDDTHFAPKNTTDDEEANGYASATREQAIALSLRTYKLSEIWK